jgi:hypothetical protein
MQRLGWTEPYMREHLFKTYSKSGLSLLEDEKILSFLSYLRSQPSPEAMVTIPTGLFDQVERYLEYRASQADGEASRLLMELEDVEIDRTAKEYGLTKQE